MALKLYNTLSRKLEDFSPITPPLVKMYCCGPTVYDFLHVGNFRGPVFYNLLRNHLEELGFEVNYVYNFTDIDDKIINKANETNAKPSEVSEKYIKEFYNDFNALKLRPHSVNPKVTESLDAVFKVIQDLIDRGKAYEIDGEVFYSISQFSDYGKLSGRKTDELLEGVRKGVDEKKKDPLDFSLWKPAKEGEQGFESPWGIGRPGWHIECTAMIQKHLGNEIDIHGGGLDLLFPHHENEIAQAEGSCPGSNYVKYWVHNNMFTFSGAKMSKSLGNIRTMRNFLEEYHGEIFKFMVLSAHYRSETDFDDQSISKAMDGLSRIYGALAWADKAALNDTKDASLTDEALEFELFIKEKKEAIFAHYNHDFATPKVFAELFEVVRRFNTLFPLNSKLTPLKKEIALIFLEFFNDEGKKLSLFHEKPYSEFLKMMDMVLLKKINIEESWVIRSIEKRLEAKKQKDFSKADSIRDELQSKFILLKDSPQGTDWEVDKTTFFKSDN
jgi:cysteinyl-tRNA synthetase